MNKSRFRESQIRKVLKRADAGVKVLDLCRELGVSSAMFHKWRAKFGGMNVSMMSRMKALEKKNRSLKKDVSRGKAQHRDRR